MFPSFRKDPNNLDDYKYFLSLSKNLSLLENKLKIPNNIPEYGNFQQHRILTLIEDKIFYDKRSNKNISRYFHSTISFDNDRNIKLSINQINQIDNILHNIKYSGYLLSLDGTHINIKSKKNPKCEFIIIDGVNDIIEDDCAHITINPGEHKPSYMREIIKAIKSKKSNVIIPGRNDEPVEYNLNKFLDYNNDNKYYYKIRPVKIILKNNFCI